MNETSQFADMPAERTVPTSRRNFLGGLAALGATTLLPGCQATGPTAEAGGRPYRIDVHHHIAPPAYSAALKGLMRGRPVLQ